MQYSQMVYIFVQTFFIGISYMGKHFFSVVGGSFWDAVAGTVHRYEPKPHASWSSQNSLQNPAAVEQAVRFVCQPSRGGHVSLVILKEYIWHP